MRVLWVLLTWIFAAQVGAAIHEEEVRYQAGTTPLVGYIAWDDARTDQRPGILVVHEWWGLNDYAKRRARMLAELGYTAMAVDMYGSGIHTEHAKEAAGFMQQVLDHAEVARQRFLAALEFLRARPTVDPTKIGAMGYCFGGATVLNMARAGLDLAAVVSFHGSLATSTPARTGAVKARVLVLNGAADEFIAPRQLADFEREMKSAGAYYRVIDYPGAKHGFTNADADRLGRENRMPIAYDAAADQASWAAMQDWFREAFGR